MSVDKRHTQFTKFYNQWQTMRDVIEGDDTIKAGGIKYVPKLDSQDTTAYNTMINRAVFENYTNRTLDGITGLIFAKAPLIELGSIMEQYVDNIDLDSSTLTDLAQLAVSEVTAVGRVGLLVDMPSVDTQGMSKADVELLNIRPYIKTYNTETIINWKTETINNVTALSMLVLFETYDQWVSEFESKTAERYRVYSLNEGVCTVRVFEKADDNYIVTSESIPVMNGKAINFIPFVSITPDNLTINPSKSPLYDIAKVNINHFATAVDYSHGAHYTALPTALFWGAQLQQGEKITLGSSFAHTFPDPSGHGEYLEFKGDGLQTLERKMVASKDSIAALGAKLLSSDSNAQIAESTMAMRTSSERSIIISIADTCSRGIKKALEIMAMWAGDNTEVQFALNTDYNLTTLDSATLRELVSAWQLGALSERELFINLQKGELIGEDVSFEDHQGELDIAMPSLSVPPAKNVPA